MVSLLAFDVSSIDFDSVFCAVALVSEVFPPAHAQSDKAIPAAAISILKFLLNILSPPNKLGYFIFIIRFT